MFQYTNTVLVNSLTDVPSGLPKFSFADDTLSVLRFMDFDKANVAEGGIIFKTLGTAPTYSKLTIDLTKITPTDTLDQMRILMYLRLSNNGNAYFSNDMVFKGKPLAYEFAWGGSATVAATNLANSITKMGVYFGDNNYIKVTAAAGVVTITSTNEYVWFRDARIQNFVAPTTYAWNGGEFVTVGFLGDTAGVVVAANGSYGFGTYDLILKDLRLPTMENLRYNAPASDERPIPGALYNQYVIYYEKLRGIQGTDAVGDLVTSRTCHVIYVNQTIATQVESFLSQLGTVTTVPAPAPEPVTP